MGETQEFCRLVRLARQQAPGSVGCLPSNKRWNLIKDDICLTSDLHTHANICANACTHTTYNVKYHSQNYQS